MIEVKERPTSGQFVEVWEYNNKIWSDTFYVDKEVFLRYNNGYESWDVQDGCVEGPDQTNKRFFIQGES